MVKTHHLRQAKEDLVLLQRDPIARTLAPDESNTYKIMVACTGH